MKKNIILFLVAAALIGYAEISYSKGLKAAAPAAAKNISQKQAAGIKVTFVELGSINCIPCKMMQPVMADIEKEYGDKVAVVFHDVWTKDGEPYAKKFNIQAIPTQVFLDKDGKEFFRHLGFFPKEEIVKILEKQGVKLTGGPENAPAKVTASETKVQSGQICK